MRHLPVLLMFSIPFMVFFLLGCYHPKTAPEYFSSENLTPQAENTAYGKSAITTKIKTATATAVVRGRVKQALSTRLGDEFCVLVLTPNEKNTLHVYKLEHNLLNEVWCGIPASLRPWKIQVADVDGDGSNDIAVGVLKKARFHPVIAKRIFVYGWDGRDVYPKWLGSRLSRPFTDFILADFGQGKVKLIAIEITKDKSNELAVYGWDEFGFTCEWRGVRANELRDLRILDGSIYVKMQNHEQSFLWNGRALEPKEVKS